MAQPPGKRKRKPAPKPRQTRTQRWQEVVLRAIEQGRSVTVAAAAAGIQRETIYRHRREDEDFTRRFEEAMQVAADRLEEEAYRRAVRGVIRKKFHKGEPIIDPDTGKQYIEREFSDPMLMFLLRGKKPEVYKERIHHSGQVDFKEEQIVLEHTAPPLSTASPAEAEDGA